MVVIKEADVLSASESRGALNAHVKAFLNMSFPLSYNMFQ